MLLLANTPVARACHQRRSMQLKLFGEVDSKHAFRAGFQARHGYVLDIAGLGVTYKTSLLAVFQVHASSRVTSQASDSLLLIRIKVAHLAKVRVTWQGSVPLKVRMQWTTQKAVMARAVFQACSAPMLPAPEPLARITAWLHAVTKCTVVGTEYSTSELAVIAAMPP